MARTRLSAIVQPSQLEFERFLASLNIPVQNQTPQALRRFLPEVLKQISIAYCNSLCGLDGWTSEIPPTLVPIVPMHTTGRLVPAVSPSSLGSDDAASRSPAEILPPAHRFTQLSANQAEERKRHETYFPSPLRTLENDVLPVKIDFDNRGFVVTRKGEGPMRRGGRPKAQGGENGARGEPTGRDGPVALAASENGDPEAGTAGAEEDAVRRSKRFRAKPPQDYRRLDG